MGDEFPRVRVLRGAKRKGTRYFGPYAHAWAIRETVDLMLRVFPVRTCSAGVFKSAKASGRPCLLGYIDKCSAPCVGRIDAAGHRELAEEFCDFLAGSTGRHLRRLEQQMRAAAAELRYEDAARLRDDLAALTKALEKSAVVLPDATEADVFALAEDDLEAAVQVFHVRGGRVRGQRGWVVEKVEDLDTAGLVEYLLQQVYGEAAGGSVPREVLVPALPANWQQLTAWLSGLRGSLVEVRVPQRGDKKRLLDTVARNAKEAMARHKVARAGDLTVRSRAMAEIQEALGLAEAPLRIECYDVSNLQGSEVVASMVVFEDGVARKPEYRRFAIRGVQGQDDVASIREVITRRFRRYLAERLDAEAPELDDGDDEAAPRARRDPTTGRPAKFAYPPQLVVVDGGPPQVAAAAAALAELGIDDIALCGLAKRLEEVWLPGEDYPVVLPRSSEGLYLLQRIRDEAHRFAITYHRQRRSTTMIRSSLDGIPGLGASRQAALLKHFGSVKKLRQAGLDEVAAVSGIGPRLASAIVGHFAAQTPEPAVNVTTGEVLD
jgi:excinuclease ABC subunit C